MTLRLVLLHLLLAGASVSALAGGEFERMRDTLRSAYTTVLPDGTQKVAKQFRRWEYFWERRLLPNGDFPTAAMMMAETRKAERLAEAQKRAEDAQAIPVWKEVGPEAPATIDQGQWNGIGRVNCMAFSYQDSKMLWLGSASGGLWKSTNNGGAWTYVPIAGYPMFGVSDIKVDPTNDKIIYIATGDADGTVPGIVSNLPNYSYGVLKSTDGGVTWQSTGISYTTETNNLVSKIWLHPTDKNIVVVATSSGMQRSVDAGRTFMIVRNGYFKDVVGHPTKPEIMYGTTFSINGGAAIFKSVDAGATWTQVYSRPASERMALAVTPADPNQVVAVSSEIGTHGLDNVYRSMDEGKTFAAMNPDVNLLGWSPNGNDANGQGFYDLAIDMSPVSASTIFVGGVNIWRSANASGTAWALSAHWTGSGADFVHADHHMLRYNPVSGDLYDVSDGGIAISENDGQNWRDISRGLRIQQFYGVSVSNLNTSLILCGAQDNGTTRFSGGNARNVFDGDGMATAIDWSNAQTMYTSNPNGVFYRSDNGGENFTFISSTSRRNEQASWVAPITIDPKNNSTVYLGYENVWKSDNSGASFTRLTPLNVQATLRIITVAPSDPKYIYVAFSSSMYVSSNGGTTWTQQSGLSGFITDIAVHPDDPKRVWVTYGGFVGGNKIVEINSGAVTNITGSTFPNVPVNAVLFQKGVLNRLYIGTDLGVYFKDEGMKEWQPYGSNMPVTVISDLALVSTTNTLRAATYGRGVWEVSATQCKATTPTITARTPTNVCSGDSIILEASPGYTRYAWSNGDTTQSIVLMAQSQTGSYTVSVEDGNGCRGLSDAMAVTIRRTPVKPSITKRGLDTLRATGISVTGYQWFLDGTKLEGVTTRDIAIRANGKYVVEVTNADKCTNISDPLEITTASSVGDDLAAASGFGLYPNPFEQKLTVQRPNAAGASTVELIDLRGQIVRSLQFDAENITIDLSDLASGAYMVRLRSGSSTWTAPVAKR